MEIQKHWLQSAKHCPSPNHNERPQQEISLIVVHNISLPPNEFDNDYVEDFFCNELDCSKHPYFQKIKDLKVSSHLLIKRDGSLVQFVGFDKRAWHAGVSCYAGRDNCNDFSVGIELQGTDDIAYTDAQYHKLVDVSRLLCDRYDISHSEITGHSDIAPGRKTDPGPSFDWSYFKQLMENA
ncbi:1,6-anhydro-N-acetylmuramyl-L-alanine amidase AmpD [Bermanella marisrubri]|nr:1,6-anhydro-N-acetylmuramyl-L-alanine amidase AmpD [Bermanella marisrubri]